ncbi:hypothetical protein PFISCL1PPCAC_723, partial [Pristionchus fissidentatus]
ILQLSISLLFYCKKRLKDLPYDSDRLSAKYQLAEVFSFTRAVLPAVLISSFLKLLALIPPTCWRAGIIDFPTNQLLFFPMHAITCVIMKCTLIAQHKGMLRTLWKVMPKYLRRLPIAVSPVETSHSNHHLKQRETDAYFNYMAVAW